VGAGAACVLPAAGVEEANNVVAGQFRDVPAGGECVGELVQDSAVGDARLVLSPRRAQSPSNKSIASEMVSMGRTMTPSATSVKASCFTSPSVCCGACSHGWF
jgi:hypothetical protein